MQKFTPMQYLKIDVASNFGHGLDREDWDVRIQWFQDHEDQFDDLIAKAESRASMKGSLLDQAKEPAMFYAGLKAWQKARKGEAINYPISLDATASGAQILAILIGCVKSAAHCNMVNTGHRQDLYTNAYRFMVERLNDSMKITRDDLKSAIMPAFYGSRARPKQIFGENLPIFEATMEEEMPGIWLLNKALLGLWDSEAYENSWILPDNYHVKVKVKAKIENWVQFMNKPYKIITEINAPTEEGRSLSANVTHSIDGMVVREMLRRCSYDPKQIENLLELLTSSKPAYKLKTLRQKDELVQTLWDRYLVSGFLSARLLDLLDENNIHMVDLEPIKELIMSLPEKPFQVLSVHD